MLQTLEDRSKSKTKTVFDAKGDDNMLWIRKVVASVSNRPLSDIAVEDKLADLGFDSLMFGLLGRRERSNNNCPGHIYFFTVPTLRRLVEQNGFAVERVDLVGRTLTGERLLYNVGLISRHAGVQRLLGRLALVARLDRLRLHLNCRDMQRLYCRAR